MAPSSRLWAAGCVDGNRVLTTARQLIGPAFPVSPGMLNHVAGTQGDVEKDFALAMRDIYLRAEV